MNVLIIEARSSCKFAFDEEKREYGSKYLKKIELDEFLGDG